MDPNELSAGSSSSRPHAAGHAVDRPDAGDSSPSALAGTLRAAFEVVFLGYLVGIAAFSREFAHLHLTVHGIPLFMGELVLLTLTILATASHLARRRLPFRLDFAAWALLTLLTAGAVLAVRGLLMGFGLAVLRDFALVYYGWFFFLTLAYLRQGGTCVRILGALLAGAVVGSVAETSRFLASPSLTWGHATAGFNGLFAWAAVVVALALATTSTGFIRRAAAAAAVAVCTFAIYLTAYRTLIFVAAVAVTVVSIWSGFQTGRSARRFAWSLWGWMALMAVLILVPRIAIPSPHRIVPVNGPLTLRDALGSISHRWTGQRFGGLPMLLRRDVESAPDPKKRGVGSVPDPQDWKGSASFRLAAWKNALVRIEASPWFGIGYGPPAILYPASGCDTAPSPTSNCGSAHNTYLTLAVRMGIPSAVLLCALLGWLLSRSVLSARKSARDPGRDLSSFVAFAALLSCAVFGLTGLLFESPYLGSVVWVLAGVIAHQTTESTSAELRTC